MKDKMDKWVDKAKTAIKWVAVDKDGNICGYCNEPTSLEGWWCIDDAWTIEIGTTDDEELRKNWKETLRKVEYGK